MVLPLSSREQQHLHCPDFHAQQVTDAEVNKAEKKGTRE